MKNAIAVVSGVALVSFMWWLGGFDFDERGFLAFYCFLTSLFGGFISFIMFGDH